MFFMFQNVLIILFIYTSHLDVSTLNTPPNTSCMNVSKVAPNKGISIPRSTL